MKKSFELLQNQLRLQESSGYEYSYDFDKFYRAFNREFKKLASSLGCTDIMLSKSYFFFSGFFTCPNGQIVYIHFEDWRWMTGLYVRTAESYKDYTGGSNHHLPIDEGVDTFITEFKRYLRWQCGVKECA